jgi:hypothetical protein
MLPLPPSPRARSTRGICVDRISSRPLFRRIFQFDPEAHAPLLFSFPSRIIHAQGRGRRSARGCLNCMAACQTDCPRIGARRRIDKYIDHRSRGRSAAFRSSVIRTGQLRRQPVTCRPTLPDANSLPCRNGGWIRAKSVAILYTANVPTPPVPEAFAPDITSWPEIDGFVGISIIIIGPWGCERSAKDGPCRQSADNRRDRKAMTPSSVRRR